MIKARLKALAGAILRRKYRVIYLYLVDRDFREDIDYLLKIKKRELVKIRVTVPLFAIEHSHRVVYRSWVDKLVEDFYDSMNLYDPVELYEYAPGRYLPLDGNHRLAALKIVLSNADDVDAWLWAPKKKPQPKVVGKNREPVSVNRQLLPDLRDPALKN